MLIIYAYYLLLWPPGENVKDYEVEYLSVLFIVLFLVPITILET